MCTITTCCCFTGTSYSSAALFKALASKPLVPPPAHKTKTFVCSLIVSVEDVEVVSSTEDVSSVSASLALQLLK